MVVDMNDASRLIRDLRQKLAELDSKVAAYRQDMAIEFHRYSRELLQNLPHDISAEVDRVVAASYNDYPALSPALIRERDRPDSTPPPPNDDTQMVTGSTRDCPDPPPPSQSSSAHPAVVPNAGTVVLTTPENVHDRERDRELDGLFTPSYLPLLDSAQPPAVTHHSPVLSPLSKPSTDSNMGRRNSGQGIDQPAVMMSVAATQTLDRPHHERRATDDTTSSGASELGDTKTRRSALRRSSSVSKAPASPRRVRFEFQGGEVLPTASPQSSEPSLVQSHTLAPSKSPPPQEDEAMSVDSLLGPDEDYGPPPKKVSSSQALRALSRAPLDANTVWTVVNPEAEKESGSLPTSGSESSLQTNDTVRPTRKAAATERAQSLDYLRPALTEDRSTMTRSEKDDDDASSSDDEFLDMAKPKSFANKKAILSPLSRSPTRAGSASHSSSTEKANPRVETGASSGLPAQKDYADEEDDEDMFHFEGLSAPPKPRSRPAPKKEDEDEEEEDNGNEVQEPEGPTLYSTSPAVSIPKPPEPQIPAHLISGSVGSFRGRPVTMPVVKNPDVYQQAASLGDVSTFIGGLDGRSGVDDGDLNSYRASVGQTHFSGTPRSLTERMMMEEMQSQRRTAAQRPH